MCPKCNIAQSIGELYFFRWKDTKIELRGCDAHIKEVMDVLRDAQENPKKVVS